MKDLNKFNANKTSHLSSGKGINYIASPYTHDNPEVVAERTKQVRLCVEELVKRPSFHAPFSPVLYTTELQSFGMEEPARGWYQFCLSFLNQSNCMIVLMLDGWEDSVGVGLEIAFAQAKEIPIVYNTLNEILTGKDFDRGV